MCEDDIYCFQMPPQAANMHVGLMPGATGPEGLPFYLVCAFVEDVAEETDVGGRLLLQLELPLPDEAGSCNGGLVLQLADGQLQSLQLLLSSLQALPPLLLLKPQPWVGLAGGLGVWNG